MTTRDKIYTLRKTDLIDDFVHDYMPKYLADQRKTPFNEATTR